MGAGHNGAVKITHAFALSCFATCAAGVLSCSDQSTNPSDIGIDGSAATAEAGGSSDISAGREAGAPILDAALEALGPESASPGDAGMDQAAIGGEPDVGASDTGIAPDAPTVPDAPPHIVPDTGVDHGADGGIDAPSKDANTMDAQAPDTRVPDVTPLDASVPDAKPDGSAGDVALLDVGPAACGRIKCDCTFNGVKLWGNVEYVTSFPDFKIKISSFPDLNVYETNFPSECGEWHTVTAFGDFKVQIVDYFEDFDIAYSPFPGIP